MHDLRDFELNDRLAAALSRLCVREGLDVSETTAVLAVALPSRAGGSSDPAPLLRRFSMPS